MAMHGIKSKTADEVNAPSAQTVDKGTRTTMHRYTERTAIKN